jgi:hypothetical protein
MASRTKVVHLDKLDRDPEFASVLLRLMMVVNDFAMANDILTMWRKNRSRHLSSKPFRWPSAALPVTSFGSTRHRALQQKLTIFSCCNCIGAAFDLACLACLNPLLKVHWQHENTRSLRSPSCAP